MSTVEQLLTAHEFAKMPDDHRHTELVRGRIVDVNPPKGPHGFVCANIAAILSTYVKRHSLGRVLCNDSGVITQHDPDTVRGADVAFYSYQRLPEGSLADTYPTQPPEFVWEVLSTGDRWSDVLQKVAEYLQAGVVVVCVADPKRQRIHLYRAEQEVEILTAEQELRLPDILAGFSVAVSEFFS